MLETINNEKETEKQTESYPRFAVRLITSRISLSSSPSFGQLFGKELSTHRAWDWLYCHLVGKLMRSLPFFGRKGLCAMEALIVPSTPCVSLFMVLPTTVIFETSFTELALVWVFPCVDIQMVLVSIVGGELTITEGTFVWFFTCVSSFVCYQWRLMRKGFWAEFTLIRLVFCMGSFMHLYMMFVIKALVTETTLKFFFSTMYFLVGLQVDFLTKWFVAVGLGAFEWLFSSVFALKVYFQITFTSRRIFT